jgi:formylglycine-generating enzyme required for sulfatase activity
MSDKQDQPQRRAVDTDGAAYVEGGVDTGGGDFVAGDKIVNIYQDGSLRAKELAYLDGLLKRYEYWLDHYTPLAGIAEVRAAVKDGPRLDLPMPFIPREFETLAEHGFGERVETKREQFDDLREAIAKHRRIILLGDPGSGKTTTLWRLAYDYALEAKEDEKAPLPVFVPLGGYVGAGPFDAYLARYLGALAPHLEAYRGSGRLVLLLDGLNEMPQADYERRVERVQEALDHHLHGMVVVTCRAIDYGASQEGLQQVWASPLDIDRIRCFLHNYLGETAGEKLFWELCGGEVQEGWNDWLASFEMLFESLRPYPRITGILRHSEYKEKFWEILWREPPKLLSLMCNPYMLLMTSQVYAALGGALPANRGRMFAAFVDTLLAREKERCTEADWIEAELQKGGLAALAYAMQTKDGGQGTTVKRKWALERLCKAVPDCDVERLLHLASSASLLDASGTTVRFYHQLLQEYFAARELGRRVGAGESLALYWPEEWWESSGWEDTFILLAGMEMDASSLLISLAQVNPLVAARCLLEGGAEANEAARSTVIETLIITIGVEESPPTARVQAGDALGMLGDPRPGVGLRDDGLPDIAWCAVPAGPFLMGSSDADEMAFDIEKPQYKVALSAFKIARYPITNAQYAAFVRDGGYTDKWRDCWTDAGWRWKGDRARPDACGGVFDLPNHPVGGVTWYEAVAFCRWLIVRLRTIGGIDASEEVTLPSEAQWEKAARGTDGRRYPWGNEPDPNRANTFETGIRTTSAVGCFPGGASPCGALDMSGNVWEWCRTERQNSCENYRDADGLKEDARRFVRGGSFLHHQDNARCAFRFRYVLGWFDLGFRVVVSPISPSSGL